jgi:hypothetical protein
MTNGTSDGDKDLGGVSRRPVRVIVTILNDNPPEFDMKSIPPDHLPIGRYGKGPEDFLLTFNNNAGGKYFDGFTLTFEVEDKIKNKSENDKYGFFYRDSIPAGRQPYDAIWVKCTDSDGHCPSKASEWSGFKPTSVSRKALTVDNPNLHLQYFGFALHFSKAGETEASLTFDPIGDDQNGHSLSR